MDKKLPTEPYKGTRDFYPEDMAVQSYIFDTWAHVAESFGFERYDSSLLEPSELYRSKTSEEIVNDQTYTFTDRGDREVTLRPEMTPTAARMIAAKRRDLTFPVRWYAIPNVFRYERPQKGRLREHWQLNCDIFGDLDYTADMEIVTLAYSVLTAFGATDDMFEIRINDRAFVNELLTNEGLNETQIHDMFMLLDRKEKIDNFEAEVENIAGKHINFDITPDESSNLSKIIAGLRELAIPNVVLSLTTVRGFQYYTGTVFEIFDTSKDNNRSLLGGGRYDNLTSLFGGDPIPGVGFGMGDVTMRDFLETHGLLTSNITAPTLVVLPLEAAQNLEAQKIAQTFRTAGIRTSVDMGTKKIGKKISSAGDAFVEYAVVVGNDEIAKNNYTLKDLTDGSETTGSIEELVKKLS